MENSPHRLIGLALICMLHAPRAFAEYVWPAQLIFLGHVDALVHKLHRGLFFLESHRLGNPISLKARTFPLTGCVMPTAYDITEARTGVTEQISPRTLGLASPSGLDGRGEHTDPS